MSATPLLLNVTNGVPLTAYPFLSPEWMDAARKIRDTMPRPDVVAAIEMKMNLIVTDTPFGDDVHGHVDNSSGEVIIEDGHVDNPDVTVTVEYEVARSIFVELDAAAAMQAFMGGRIKVDGDITKMLALQAPTEPDEKALAIAEAMKAITA